MTTCLYCNIILLHKNNKFCSRSCAAKFNNKIRTKESRKKQGITLVKSQEKFKEENEIYPYTEVYANICEECDTLFYAKTQRRGCSKQCQSKLCSKQKTGIKIGSPDFYAGKPTKAYLKKQGLLSKPKNRNKPIDYSITDQTCEVCPTIFRNKNKRRTCSKECQYKLLQGSIGHTTHPVYTMKNGKDIILGSSWELRVARQLDSLNIDWIRPDSLPWIDVKGKNHSYYADFYLPKYDVYLDPKNSLKIESDKEKLKYFEDKIILFYGETKHIMDKVKSYL
jgi:hypothetical protein